MDSEVELNTTVQELRVVSTRPDLYSLLFETNCLQLLLGLLSHENLDICCVVVSVLQELTDVDPNSEGVDNIKKLVDNLVWYKLEYNFKNQDLALKISLIFKVW